jgi:hypothetical protein
LTQKRETIWWLLTCTTDKKWALHKLKVI